MPGETRQGCPHVARLLDDYDHHDPEFVEDPWPVYQEMREHRPVLHTDRHGGYWVLSRYADVHAAGKNWETFTSSVPNVTAIPSSHHRERPDLPIELDPPEHSRYRRLIAPVFSRPRVEGMRETVRIEAEKLVRALAAAEQVDLVSQYAQPMSVATLGEFMNMPVEDRMRWVHWVQRMYNLKDAHDSHAANEELRAYIADLVAERRREPREDFLSMLLASEIEGARLTDEEVRSFALVLFIAGHETTASAMGSILHYLAVHPEVRSRLASDPELRHTAVEEFLRYFSPLPMLARNATRDIEAHGVTIPKGDVVGLCYAAANHDDTVFEDAESLVFDRSPNRHVAFGAGPHVCAGAHIARLEIDATIEAFGTLVEDLSLDPERPPVFKPDGHVRGFASLPARIRLRSEAAR